MGIREIEAKLDAKQAPLLKEREEIYKAHGLKYPADRIEEDGTIKRAPKPEPKAALKTEPAKAASRPVASPKKEPPMDMQPAAPHDMGAKK